MQIPNVGAQEIRDSMKRFDTDLRSTTEWQDWDKKISQLYALVEGGRRYPPKQIISMATSISVTEFSGGKQTNDYLEKRGFEIAILEHDIPQSATLKIATFEIGKIYNRINDINLPFGGSRQSGISASRSTPAIFLFTGKSGEQFGYADGFDSEDVFSYTGEGQTGDMEFTRGNAAIRDHAATGRALHLFESHAKGKGHKYLGEFAYSNHSFRTALDANKTERRVIVFHLVRVAPALDNGNQAPTDVPNVPPPKSLLEARKRALNALGGSEGGAGRSAQRMLYQRSEAVRQYVLMRSKGECESCQEPAPFKRRDGSPYLEPHHTTRLSDGGLDHPRYVGAICPNCHREIHFGADGANRNARLQDYVANREDEIDIRMPT